METGYRAFRRACLAGATVVCALILARPARALDPAKPLGRCAQLAWRARDGLPGPWVRAIAQTPDKSLVGPMVLSLSEGAGAAGMVGGQQIDLSPRADVHEIHAKKTAALFQASTHLGALAAKSPKAGNLAKYGLHLGLAFQAVDDILDASEEGRRNVARIYGLKKAHALAAQEVAAAKAAVRFMGVHGERLRQIADFVLSRKH